MSARKSIAAAAAIVLSVLTAMPVSLHGALVCAKAGKPAAEIVIPENADPTVKLAADELQLWIAKISGAKLAIVKAEDPAKAQIVLDPASKNYPADKAKFQDNDGFSVREKGNKVYLNAGRSKGILNGVFQLLYRNSDIIWARPDETFGTIFTPDPDLTLKQTDFIDIPAFILRGWQMGRRNAEANNIWQVRNRSNWIAMDVKDPLKKVYGCWLEYGGGHNIVSVYIPEHKYFKTHPEFYPLKNGKRLVPHEHKALVQLCFTNPELVKTFISEVDARIKANPQFDTYRIMIEDQRNLCECPECMKPIRLPDGKTVDPKDPAFRSTQFFMMLNQIARYVKEKYPSKRILTFAYMFTLIPPACPVESNIDISFCPISKNSKHPITAKENEKTLERFSRWSKLTKNITWREYYGLCGDFPRPIDVVAFADWQYVNKHGSIRTYSEMRADADAPGQITRSWDVNSLYFWMLTQGCWNPCRDVKALRKEFLTRVYGKAADDVAEYYRLIEEQWFKIPGRSIWNDVANTNWKTHVLETGIVPQCRAALDRAAKKVDKPNGKKMLAALRKNFESYVDLANNRRVTAIKTASVPEFDPDFKSGDWTKAPAAEQFNLNTSLKRHPDKTEMRLLYDEKNLYVGIKCDVPDVSKMLYRKPVKGEKVFPWGEGFEIYLNADGGKTVQVVTDPSGNRFSNVPRSKWTAQVKITDHGWSALVTIPWKAVTADPAKAKELKGMFIRQFMRAKKEGEAPWRAAVLFSGRRKKLSDFCKVELN
ncbi:MAG: DUF4838 domain-containing protein [Lentisphaeria bacterium]|nr:DUF4838 domain-containing protein [Lentisphaeria bacterium]